MLNILILFVVQDLMNKENNSCFTDCIKNFNVGMHTDSIWFKLGLIQLNSTF